MPEEQRLKEDMEFAARTREKEKGQMGFLQKYYHKGAFHQVSLFQRGKRNYKCADELDGIGRRSAQKRLCGSDGKLSRHDPLTQSNASSGLW